MNAILSYHNINSRLGNQYRLSYAIIIILSLLSTICISGKISLAHSSPQEEKTFVRQKQQECSFQYRICLGWIQRISSQPFQRFSDDLKSKWTARCDITNQLVHDYQNYFLLMKQENINYMVQWGLFGENWPTNFVQDILPERKAKIKLILKSAHQNNVKFLSGFGIAYQMRKIVSANPHLAQVTKQGKHNQNALCLNRPESQKIIRTLFRELFDSYHIDGLSLELGERCHCSYCRKLPPMEYLRQSNLYLISWIKQNWPQSTIMVYVSKNSDCPENIYSQYLKELASMCDILDLGVTPTDISSLSSISNLRWSARNFIHAHWIVPPWSWNRLRWFLPQTIQETESIRKAHQLGAIGYTWCSGPINNPGENITTRFRGRFSQNPHQDPQQCLKTVLQDIYQPQTERALDVLTEVVLGAEKAYPWELLPNVLHTEIYDYLGRLDEKQRLAYCKAIQALRDDLAIVYVDCRSQKQVEELLQCLENVLTDVKSPPEIPEEIRLRPSIWKTIPKERFLK